MDEEEKETRWAFAGGVEVDPAGKFEVIAITAGTGNTWEFGVDVLKASMQLWDKAQVFIDHDLLKRSVKDLAGVLYSPRWDEGKRGVRLSVKPFGPNAELLEQTGREMLKEDEVKPDIGFSADLVFTAKGQKVEKIIRVNSVDLVFSPARGGAFVRALNQIVGINPEDRETSQGAKMDEEKKEEGKSQEILTAQCGHLLDQALSASKLPVPVAARVRAQFAGKVFEPAALDAEIASSREMVSALTGPESIQGPGRIHSIFSSEDQISAAVHDLLGADRPDELKTLKTARLSGIRELYTLATGDMCFEGGYDPQRAQFATTADLPGVLKNALNVLVLMQWQELGKAGYRWWEKIVDVQHFNTMHDLTGVLMGEITPLPVVAEAGSYTQLELADSPETGAFVKYGGYVGLTLEMIERDQTNKLVEIPKKLASSALRRISSLVSAVFTANAGVGPVMADALNVFELGTHANLLTVALASAALETASAAIYNQSMVVGAGGTAPKLGIDGKYLLVPRALRLTGMRLLYPSFEREATIFSENMQKGEFGDVITVPEWTDATDWALVADPRLAPAIILAERFGVMPELFIADNQLQGAFFTNDELRIKVRHVCHVMVADYRPLHKSNVAG
jgi:hypothetical protein